MIDLVALPKPRFTRRETTSIGRQIVSAMPAFALGLLWRLRDRLTHPAPRTAHPAKTHTSRALRLVKHQLELVSHPAEFWKRTGLHLLHRPAAMHLHRGFGDADIVSNLFAQPAACHLNYDLALPGAQGGET